MKRTYPLIFLLLLASFLLGACGASDNDSVIATAVAQTLQAQNTTPEISVSATPADPGPAPLTQTPEATPTTSSAGVSYTKCMVASLVSENPPDGTIYKPGTKFLKTWHIQNNSDCTWTKSYKIVFWKGDQMGGFYNYNFPQNLPPGQSADVTIELAAPDNAGNYRGEWMLQTPDGQNFGMGQYSTPFWTAITVSTAEVPGYGVASVAYDWLRDPLTGCPTNTRYTFTANVSFSGPVKEVILQFWHSDGFRSSKIKLEVKEASTQSFTDAWKFYFTDTQGSKWVQLVQLFPEHVEYNKLEFNWTCN
jgi:hypothetical protein